MSNSPNDTQGMKLAIVEAQNSYAQGGVPIGSALLTDGGAILGVGHNERVQKGDPIAHAEISCIRNAGRRASYAGTTLYTTLSPCEMCSGAILLFKIRRVVVGENSTFLGDLDCLRRAGVEVVLENSETCKQLMMSFKRESPDVWREDIGESQ